MFYNQQSTGTLLFSMTNKNFILNSFFPVGIKLWNTLDDSFKCVATLSSTGDRHWNLVHSKMRINCSPLKEHLTHNLHVIENSTCDCGFSVENNFYFLLEYRLHTQNRQSVFMSFTNNNH